MHLELSSSIPCVHVVVCLQGILHVVTRAMLLYSYYKVIKHTEKMTVPTFSEWEFIINEIFILQTK